MITTQSLKRVFWAMVPTALILSIWLSIPTELLLKPKAIKYDGNRVTFVRETPFGDVWGDWTTEIRVNGGPGECHSGKMPAHYQVDEDNTIEYDLGPWAKACIEHGPPMIVVNRWQAKLFGLIPLRPAQITTIVEGARK